MRDLGLVVGDQPGFVHGGEHELGAPLRAVVIAGRREPRRRLDHTDSDQVPAAVADLVLVGLCHGLHPSHRHAAAHTHRHAAGVVADGGGPRVRVGAGATDQALELLGVVAPLEGELLA